MKFIKYIIYVLLFLGLLAFVALKYFSEDKPIGQGGAEADQLANLVLEELNKNAFDTIPMIRFEFFGGTNKYLWDKQNERVIVEWSDNKVELDLNSMAFLSYKDGVKLEGDQAYKLKEAAWSKWCNDSFWLIAPYKIFDKGTQRTIVEIEKEIGTKGLLVEYASGGVTPGDAYLWILDENNRPMGWKMWTKIIPLQGMYTSWENWEEFDGAILSTGHKLAGKVRQLENVKAGKSFSDFGYSTNPFNI